MFFLVECENEENVFTLNLSNTYPTIISLLYIRIVPSNAVCIDRHLGVLKKCGLSTN